LLFAHLVALRPIRSLTSRSVVRRSSFRSSCRAANR
jgi:hypothetical protein